MSKGTFAPVSLNTPATVFSSASTKKAVYSTYIDASAMLTGDTLKVIIQTNTTSSTKILITDLITIDVLGDDQVAVSYPILLDINETYTVILEQTTGTVRSYPWAVNLVEY